MTIEEYAALVVADAPELSPDRRRDVELLMRANGGDQVMIAAADSSTPAKASQVVRLDATEEVAA